MITCTFEDGGKGKLRHVTVNAIIIKDNEVLLGKRGTHAGKPILESGKWGLIGGFLDRDENTQQAIIREAREETGCELIHLKLLLINDAPDRPREDRQNVNFIYIAEVKNQVSIQDEETTELKWFPLDALPPMEEMAFDHGHALLLYKKYLAENFALPYIGKCQL